MSKAILPRRHGATTGLYPQPNLPPAHTHIFCTPPHSMFPLLLFSGRQMLMSIIMLAEDLRTRILVTSKPFCVEKSAKILSFFIQTLSLWARRRRNDVFLSSFMGQGFFVSWNETCVGYYLFNLNSNGLSDVGNFSQVLFLHVQFWILEWTLIIFCDLGISVENWRGCTEASTQMLLQMWPRKTKSSWIRLGYHSPPDSSFYW